MLPEPIAVTLQVADALETLGVPWRQWRDVQNILKAQNPGYPRSPRPARHG